MHIEIEHLPLEDADQVVVQIKKGNKIVEKRAIPKEELNRTVYVPYTRKPLKIVE